MSIDNLETFLEKHIEGFFNKKLSSTLEFSELLKQLERELLHNKKKLDGVIQVPNAYFIALSPDDYQRMCVKRFLDALYMLAEKLVIKHNLFMEGRLEITLQRQSDIKPGVFMLWSEFLAAPEEETTSDDDSESAEAPSSTMVMDREEIRNGIDDTRSEYKTVSLLAMEGPDIDSYLEFGERQIYIGRKPHNDFILTDSNASRLHAAIVYKHHRHYISDTDSLNGTFLNGKEVLQECLLKNGDEIRIGETVLLYEVI